MKKLCIILAFFFLVGAAYVPVIKLNIEEGDLYINKKPSRIFLKEDDGTCCYLSASNTEVLTCTSIACPK